MAHMIAKRADGKDAMAYVGDTPWHGLGQPLTKGASIGVWKKEAGLDWVAQEGTPKVSWYPSDGATQVVEFPEHKALFRSDTKAPLAIVGAGYKVVQPGDVLEFFRKLVEVEGWWIHTAGCLFGGRKVWAMATRGDKAGVDKGGKDTIYQNLLLATSLDGSMRTLACETAVRAVCWNTVSMALDAANASGRLLKISHRQEFDPAEVHAALGLHLDRFADFMETARELADTPVKLDEANELLRTVFQVDAKPKVNTAWLGKLTDAAMPQEEEEDAPRGLQRVLALFQGEGKGSALKTAKGTRWGLFNAVTEYVDHEMGRTDNTRLDGAWFGRGAQLKTRALATLTTQ